jgi:hypothetical protein
MIDPLEEDEEDEEYGGGGGDGNADEDAADEADLRTPGEDPAEAMDADEPKGDGKEAKVRGSVQEGLQSVHQQEGGRGSWKGEAEERSVQRKRDGQNDSTTSEMRIQKTDRLNNRPTD